MMSTLTQTRETLPSGTWQLDPVHSHVGFAVEYVGGTFRGSFSPVQATLAVGEDGEAELTGSARVESVKVQDEDLAAHLLSPEFFDAERAPEIRFASTAIRRSGPDLTAAGELSIRGLARPVELVGKVGDPITDAFGRERISLTLSGTLDRREFGLDWNLELGGGEPALAHDVALTAELFLVRA